MIYENGFSSNWRSCFVFYVFNSRLLIIDTYLVYLAVCADDTVGTVDEQLAFALRVAGSILVRNKYLYDLLVVISGLWITH